MVMTSGVGITVPTPSYSPTGKAERRVVDLRYLGKPQFQHASVLGERFGRVRVFRAAGASRGAEMTVTLVMGQYSRRRFTGGATTLAQSLAAAEGQGVHADLSIVDSILAQIDAGISGGTLSDDELSKLESA